MPPRPIFKTLLNRSWAVAWPMTLIMVFEFLITFADVYIAGQIGKEVQAAYGFVVQIYFIFTVLANALTVGTVSVVSRLCGERDNDTYASTLFSVVLTTTVLGIFLSLGGILLSPWVLEISNVPEVVKTYGRPLILIYAGGLLFHYVLINTNGILRACEGIKKSLATMALVCVTNISLNVFFVFFTPLGFRGIALSTAASVVLGAALNLYHLRMFLRKSHRYLKESIWKIIRIGWPTGLLQVLWQAGATALYLILGALPGDSVAIMAAFTNGYRVESLIYLPAFAFNMANAVIVGNFLGKKEREEAYRGGLTTAAMGTAIVSILTVAVILNARWVSALLSDNPTVITEGIGYLTIALISEPFMAWGVILAGGLNGAGDTRTTMAIVSSAVWGVRIPLALALGVGLSLGPEGVWWAMNASIFFQTFLITRRYVRRRWMDLD